MYVNVVLHVNDEGRIDPLAVIWPDGRTFRIDEVLYRGEPGQMQKGAKTSRFRIRFGRKETNLYLERRQGSPALGTTQAASRSRCASSRRRNRRFRRSCQE